MKYLYHGSKFKADSLKPGIHHTGTLTQWDKTESNEYLYATPDRDEAIRQGFASTVEKDFDVDRFHMEGNRIEVYYSPNAKRIPSADKIRKLSIYLYTIAYGDHDGWVVVNNKHNGLGDREYKTTHSLKKQIVSCETIEANSWLARYTITVKETQPTPSLEHHRDYFNW